MYSGGNTRIYDILKNNFSSVDIIENNWGYLEFLRVLVEKLPFNIAIRLRFRLHLLFSRLSNKFVTKQLQVKRYDILFCAYSFHSLANLKLPYDIKIVFTSDAAYTVYKRSELGEMFGSYFSISRLLDRWILRHEIKVYNSVDLLMWPSKWMQNGAEHFYGVDHHKSIVNYWGANLSPTIAKDVIIENSFDEGIKLLFVGRDWRAKGGDYVVQVAERLSKMGYNVSLTIVGCDPDINSENVKINVYPYLDKENNKELALLETLYRSSHFFIMPSIESYGFAFCEASAYALPSLCLNVGGVPVVSGVNGYALEQPIVSDYVDIILNNVKDEISYYYLRETTFEFYKNKLNWDAWVGNCKEQFNKLITN